MKCKDTNVELANDYFAQGKKHYMAAANLLPKDEEFRLREHVITTRAM